MFNLVDEDEGQQFLEEQHQGSIYSSTVQCHETLVIGSFQRIINRVLEERLNIMSNCGVNPTKYFYGDMRNELMGLLASSINRFFDENGE